MVLRAAYVMHGKLGALDRGTGAAVRAVDGATAGLDLVAMCYAALRRHVIEANRKEYTVDLIGHSWNPEVGPALDALFNLRASAHEQQTLMRNRALCFKIMAFLRECKSAINVSFEHYGLVGRGASSCERTASHMLGMQRAVQLKAAVEKVRSWSRAC